MNEPELCSLEEAQRICTENGWWTHWVDNVGWEPCTEAEAEQYDFNRLATEGGLMIDWSEENKRSRITS